MRECSKSIIRRMRDPGFSSFYFSGSGIDIGGKPDPLSFHKHLFPKITNIKTWDIDDGDALYMKDVPNDCFDFVHSSHCMEHLKDPAIGLENWIRITKPGGFLIILVPDEDMYEQGIFPSTFNNDHRWSFTIGKAHSWSNKSINLVNLISSNLEQIEILKIELLFNTYNPSLPRIDQTLTPLSESGIEIILRKRLDSEDFLFKSAKKAQPDTDTRIHFNQILKDKSTLKNENLNSPPFLDDKEI